MTSPHGHNTGTTLEQVATAQGGGNRGPDNKTVARLLDLKGAGAYLGVSYWTVRDLVFAGSIPTVKIPSPRARDGRVLRRILIDREDLDRFIEANKETE